MNETAALRFGVETAFAIARDQFDRDAFAEQLSVLFDADGGAGFVSMTQNSHGPKVTVIVGGGPPCSEATASSGAAFSATHPGVLGQRREGTARAVRLSDEVNLRWFWTTETWWVMHHPWDGRYSLGAALYSCRDEVAFVGLNRGNRDFTDAELLTLTRLQQPVSAAFRYRRALQKALDQLGAAQVAPVPPRFDVAPLGSLMEAPTRREAEVLTLMSAGWTNDQIASRLMITERTVRKHLSSVYEKAGLPGRAAAASWWERQRDLA